MRILVRKTIKVKNTLDTRQIAYLVQCAGQFKSDVRIEEDDKFINAKSIMGVISLAIKKTPVLKMPLLAVACIPISIYQAASVSIDCMIIALGIYSIAYFIYMSQAEENSLTSRDIAVFTVICIILGLCKLTYLAFIFLLLLVPLKNYQNLSSVCGLGR